MVGCYDTQLTAQLIAIYQSCVNGTKIEEIIRKSSIDPKNSLLTSYFHQADFFEQSNATSNSLNSPVIKQLLESTRNKFNAFKYLTITSNHFNFNKDLPINYLLFIMQLNQQRYLKTFLVLLQLDCLTNHVIPPARKYLLLFWTGLSKGQGKPERMSRSKTPQ